MGISAIISTIVSAVTSVGAEVATAASVFGAEAATTLGLSTGIGEALGTAIGGTVIGGGLGAAEAAITGQDPLKRLEFGAITGGVGGGLTSGLEQAGISPALAGTVATAGAGALGATATGQNPLTGALMGGAAGYLTSGGPNPFTNAPSTPAAATPGAGVASAPAAAAPASVGADAGPIGAGGGGGLTLTPPTSAALDPTASGFGSMSPTGAAVGNAGATDFAGGAMSPNAVSGALPGDFGTGAASGASGTGTQGLSSPATGGGAGTGGATGQNLTTNPVSPSATTATAHTAATSRSGLLGSVSKNPMMALDLGLVGLSALRGQQTVPAEGVLNSQAGRLSAQGAQMEGYLTSGTLPPGLQGTLTSAGNSAEAAIRSQYAAHGMTGSSAEAQDVAAEQARVQQQGSQLALQMFQQGLNETNMADSIYSSLMQQEMQRDNALGQSIGAFAQSLALMGQPVVAGAA